MPSLTIGDLGCAPRVFSIDAKLAGGGADIGFLMLRPLAPPICAYIVAATSCVSNGFFRLQLNQPNPLRKLGIPLDSFFAFSS